MKRLFFVLPLLLTASITNLYSQQVDFTIGEKFAKRNNHYASQFAPVLITADRTYFYAQLYHSYYMYEVDHTPKVINIYKLDDMVAECAVSRPVAINGTIYFKCAKVEKVGKQTNVTFDIYPWKNGQLGTAKTVIASMDKEYGFTFAQSNDKEYFALTVMHGRDESRNGKPNHYDIFVFDKQFNQVWRKERVQINGRVRYNDYLNHSYSDSKHGFNGSSTVVGNDGSLILPYTREGKEGKIEYTVTNCILFNSKGVILANDSLPLKDYDRYMATTVNLDKVTAHVIATNFDKGRGKFPGYQYWFKSKDTGADLALGRVEVTDSVEAAGRKGTFESFLQPVVVATENYVYVILEEYQQSSSEHGPPYASTFHGDLMVFQHDIVTGKIVNQHYIPKSQRVTGISMEYYYASFIAVPNGDKLNIIYQSIGYVARSEEKDESYHTYIVTLNPDGTLSKNRLFESRDSNTGIRVSTLTSLGKNQYLIICEEKNSGKPALITVK